MKIQWMAAALLSSALTVACSDRSPENNENAPGNEGTSVALAPEGGDQANLQPRAAEPSASSPNRDGSADRPPTQGARPTTGTRSAPAARPSLVPAPARREDAPRASAPPPVRVREVTLPVGTALALELTSAVSSDTAQIETPVTARVRQAVVVDGVTVIPAGAVVNGEVVDVDRPGRVQGRARLGLRFTSVTVAGERQDIRTNPVTFQGEQTKGEDATKIGAGAGIGAVIGGIVGGGDGAAKGAAIGGAAGTGAVLATRGSDVTLASGTDINTTLASAAEIELR